MKKLGFLMLVPSLALAAPHKADLEEKVFHSLRHPHHQAVSSINQLGGSSYEKLKDISFNEKLPMKTRWKSFMVMTQISGKKSIPDIEKALANSAWFMRSAGLTAAAQIDRQEAMKWAYSKLDKDPSLLVRMKAFEILSLNKSDSVTELFWKKLNSKDSFHQNKSLWIREDLAQNLSKNPREKDLARWVHVLHDSDKKLQMIATRALASLSRDSSASEKDLAFWKEKFPQKKSL